MKKHTKTSQRGSKGVRCHVHGERVKRDCGLPQCVFHTTYPGVKCCMLVYLNKQNMKAFKPIDIGMLKRVPESAVTKDLARATVLMRGETLKIPQHSSVEDTFTTLMGRKACYCCERAITSRLKKTSSYVKLPHTKEKIWYCSSACQKEKPPQWVYAEMAGRSDMASVLRWATKKYSTLGGLEQALGMSRALLGESLLGVLGIEAGELYPTTKRVKTRSKSLVRRTGSKPEWLLGFYESRGPMVAAMEKEHGPRTLDLSALKTKVEEIIQTI